MTGRHDRLAVGVSGASYPSLANKEWARRWDACPDRSGCRWRWPAEISNALLGLGARRRV